MFFVTIYCFYFHDDSKNLDFCLIITSIFNSFQNIDSKIAILNEKYENTDDLNLLILNFSISRHSNNFMNNSNFCKYL